MTATNPNVNIVQWFADNIFGDLQAGARGVHPVLQVDAIRYLYTFRYQVRSSILICTIRALIYMSLTAHKRAAGFGAAPATQSS